MKRNALACIIPALFVMGTVNAAEIYNKDGNKLDLYGKVDARHVFSDDAGQDGDATYARLGIKGETQINDQLTGYGQWEYNLQANNTEDAGNQAWTRLAFAGLKVGDAGSFDYGRNYGVVYDVEAWTDVLPVFGGDSYTHTDNYMTGRGNGMATYRNTDFFGLVDGLNFALQYQGKNENPGAGEGTANGNRKVTRANGDGFGISSSYEFAEGFSIGAAYSNADRTLEQSRNTLAPGNKAEAWTTGLKYDANNLYLAMMYAETRNMTPFGDSYIANKTQNFEAVAQYQFDFGLRPSLAYLQSKGKDLNAGIYGNNKDLVKYVDVGAYYYFNKNMSAYVDYKINLLDGDDGFYQTAGISTDDQVGIGMVYQF
jgi:Outer membrane protein (porin)